MPRNENAECSVLDNGRYNVLKGNDIAEIFIHLVQIEVAITCEDHDEEELRATFITKETCKPTSRVISIVFKYPPECALCSICIIVI